MQPEAHIDVFHRHRETEQHLPCQEYNYWLNAKKERSETRPGRIVKRMETCLCDVEAGMESPLAVEEVMNGKFIRVGGNRVGYTFHGEWKWTAYANSRYSDETREMSRAYAEGE